MDIKKNIKSMGVQLKDIADELKITPSALTQSLNSDMSMSRLVDIARICDCTLDELVNGKKDVGIVCPHCGKPLTIKIE